VHRRRIAWVTLAAVAVLVAAFVTRAHPVAACAFDPRRPQTYEADQGRSAYLTAIDAASVNRLFPGDPYFGLPPVRTGTRNSRVDGPGLLPAVLMKAIAWVESDLTMASRSVQFNSIGDALVSFDCGHGVMQVTTGMTIPLAADGSPTVRQLEVATHYVYNIARGAWVLADKWNMAPETRPIAGTDTGGNPLLLENWYYAVWAYNGFTGPGSVKSNHPLDPGLSWPRPAYRCDGTQSRDRYPYQELVWGCMANPPQRNNQLLWQPMPATLPDLTKPAFFDALALSKFRYPYAGMDMPTPQPAHLIAPASVPAGYPQSALGAPQMSVDGVRTITIRTQGSPAQATASVKIRNLGTGILPWEAKTTDNFLVLTPPAGVAVGPNVACTTSSCPTGTLRVTVNPTLLPKARSTGTITITAPGSNAAPVVITVNVVADFEVGTPGTSRAR
jgi:hypothetical protein